MAPPWGLIGNNTFCGADVPPPGFHHYRLEAILAAQCVFAPLSAGVLASTSLILLLTVAIAALWNSKAARGGGSVAWGPVPLSGYVLSCLLPIGPAAHLAWAISTAMSAPSTPVPLFQPLASALNLLAALLLLIVASTALRRRPAAWLRFASPIWIAGSATSLWVFVDAVRRHVSESPPSVWLATVACTAAVSCALAVVATCARGEVDPPPGPPAGDSASDPLRQPLLSGPRTDLEAGGGRAAFFSGHGHGGRGGPPPPRLSTEPVDYVKMLRSTWSFIWPQTMALKARPAPPLLPLLLM